MDDAKNVEKGLQEQIKAYKKLQKIAESQEFQDYFDFQMKTVADKMLWSFTTGKDGDNVKNWDDFCRVRGEIVARLQPLQDVYGSKQMVNYLKQQLDMYYKNQLD